MHGNLASLIVMLKSCAAWGQGDGQDLEGGCCPVTAALSHRAMPAWTDNGS